MQCELPGYKRNLVGKRRFARTRCGSAQPFGQASINLESILVVKRQGFVSADWRKPEFVGIVFEILRNPSPKTFRIAQRPQPDVGIQ
jgi:hypothetical protein